MFKRILVALDGSESADRALDFAIDIAEKYSANIVLLSVYHQVNYLVGTNFVKVMQEYLEAQRTQLEKVLSEALTKVKRIKPSLKVLAKLVEGQPADKIVETAEEGKIDIIVIGSRGLGGVKELLLGSVSDRVADHATCPVLIIK